MSEYPGNKSSTCSATSVSMGTYVSLLSSTKRSSTRGIRMIPFLSIDGLSLSLNFTIKPKILGCLNVEKGV